MGLDPRHRFIVMLVSISCGVFFYQIPEHFSGEIKLEIIGVSLMPVPIVSVTNFKTKMLERLFNKSRRSALGYYTL